MVVKSHLLLFTRYKFCNYVITINNDNIAAFMLGDKSFALLRIISTHRSVRLQKARKQQHGKK